MAWLVRSCPALSAQGTRCTTQLRSPESRQDSWWRACFCTSSQLWQKNCQKKPKNADFCYLFKGVACNGLEGLLNIDCLLGTGFKIWDVVLALTPSLCSLGCYLKHKGACIILWNNGHRSKRSITLKSKRNSTHAICDDPDSPVCSPSQSCCPAPQKGNSLGLEDWPGSRIRPSSCLESWRCWVLWHQTPGHSSRLHGRTLRLKTGTSPDLLYPKSEMQRTHGVFFDLKKLIRVNKEIKVILYLHGSH